MRQTIGPVEPAARKRSPWRWPVIAVAAVLAMYLVIRGVAEFFVIHYGAPASYRNDWGGPSLAGVFAVHSGPGLVIVGATAWWALRRRRRRRRI